MKLIPSSLTFIFVFLWFQFYCIHGHIYQILKNLKALTVDQLRWRISVQHSIKGYLRLNFYNDPTTCSSLNSIYYYKLATCIHSGDPNAVADYVMLTMVLKENEYHIQWTYYRDPQCTSIIGYPSGGKILKQTCNQGITSDVVEIIPSTPPSGFTTNTLLVMLYHDYEICTSRAPKDAIQAVFTPLGQCLYSYYGDLKYQTCDSTAFNGVRYGSKDGTCTKKTHPFDHTPKDPCESKDINLDATYNGYYNFICT